MAVTDILFIIPHIHIQIDAFVKLILLFCLLSTDLLNLLWGIMTRGNFLTILEDVYLAV